MENFFEEIVTNPAEFKDNGLLSLKRRVDPSGKQHGCKVGCSANMCKGVSEGAIPVVTELIPPTANRCRARRFHGPSRRMGSL